MPFNSISDSHRRSDSSASHPIALGLRLRSILGLNLLVSLGLTSLANLPVLPSDQPATFVAGQSSGKLSRRPLTLVSDQRSGLAFKPNFRLSDAVSLWHCLSADTFDLRLRSTFRPYLRIQLPTPRLLDSFGVASASP